MELKSKVFIICTPYKGKSKFDFWKNLRTNDLIQVVTTLKHTGYGHSGIYAPEFTIVNLTQDTIFKDTINSIQNYLNKIEMIESLMAL